MKLIKIGVDIDGVCRNIVDSLIYTYKQHYPDDEVKPVLQWNLQDSFPEKHIRMFMYKVFVKEVFYDNAKLYDDFKPALRRLYDIKNNTEIIVTAITEQQPESAVYTLKWINNCCDVFDDIIFVNYQVLPRKKKKSYYDFHIVIDDSPDNIREYLDAGIQTVVRKQPWNIEVQSLTDSVDNFHGFVDIIINRYLKG